MRSKHLFSIFAVLAIVLASGCNKPQPQQTEQTLPTETGSPAVSNDLPNLSITKLDGTQLKANELKGKTILVFFHPNCDHCQREATQMREHLSAFQQHQLYFISDAELPLVAKFAADYKLSQEPNFTFGRTNTVDIFNTVGPLPTPSVFIYAEDGRLVKDFKGETPIEHILPHL